MPRLDGFLFSAILHIGVLLVAFVGLPQLFKRELPKETPIVVELVNIAPETRATQVNKTPPKPKKDEQVAEAQETPPPPKPEPPKPPPPPTPPPTPAPKPPEPKPPEPKPEPPKPEPPKPEPPPPPPPPPPEPKPPEPKPPEPKPEPPKPQPPKPPPPKPPEPKQQAKKKDDADFDTLLKNLSKRDPVRSEEEKPQPKRQTAAASPASSQPIAPLGPKLTTSEMDAVVQQIGRCWNIPAGAKDAHDLVIDIRVAMNPDATVREAHIVSTDRMGDPFYRAAAESALRAVRNPDCSPLKLPADKFDQWQTMTLTFNPKDLL